MMQVKQYTVYETKNGHIAIIGTPEPVGLTTSVYNWYGSVDGEWTHRWSDEGHCIGHDDLNLVREIDPRTILSNHADQRGPQLSSEQLEKLTAKVAEDVTNIIASVFDQVSKLQQLAMLTASQTMVTAAHKAQEDMHQEI